MVEKVRSCASREATSDLEDDFSLMEAIGEGGIGLLGNCEC
jgi:hypothetical protein